MPTFIVDGYGSTAPIEITASKFHRDEDWFVFSDGSGVVKCIRVSDVRQVTRKP